MVDLLGHADGQPNCDSCDQYANNSNCSNFLALRNRDRLS
jgi:hypothetical protein